MAAEPLSDEDRHLLELMRDLTSRPGYVTGDERFPRAVTRADACAMAADVHQAIDEATAKRAEVAAQLGEKIACGPGCNACCEQMVMIWAPEAALIAEWLGEPDQAEIRAAFLDAYPSWIARTATVLEEVRARTAAADGQGQFRALVGHWRLRIQCAFNRAGLCTIYPVRPTVCRTHHALDTSANCRPDDETGTAAASLHFVPLEDFVKKTRALSMAAHHALGGEKLQAEALCKAVHDRLDGA